MIKRLIQGKDLKPVTKLSAGGENGSTVRRLEPQRRGDNMGPSRVAHFEEHVPGKSHLPMTIFDSGHILVFTQE